MYEKSGKCETTSKLSKTYSTRYGALFLFADTYYSWADDQKQSKENLYNDIKTLENFRSIILQFGVVCFFVFKLLLSHLFLSFLLLFYVILTKCCLWTTLGSRAGLMLNP